jgi:hypothetical protein
MSADIEISLDQSESVFSMDAVSSVDSTVALFTLRLEDNSLKLNEIEVNLAD